MVQAPQDRARVQVEGKGLVVVAGGWEALVQGRVPVGSVSALPVVTRCLTREVSRATTYPVPGAARTW
jgi:hypothetical protein